MVYIIKNVIPFCHCKSYLNISISKFSSLTIFCKCSFDLCQTGKCTSLRIGLQMFRTFSFCNVWIFKVYFKLWTLLYCKIVSRNKMQAQIYVCQNNMLINRYAWSWWSNFHSVDLFFIYLFILITSVESL